MNESKNLTNYETWIMHLILNKNQALSTWVHDLLVSTINILTSINADVQKEKYKPFSKMTRDIQSAILYDAGETLKDRIQEDYSVHLEGVTVIKVDCEAWTHRDFHQIDWCTLVKVFLNDELRALGYREA
jgi:hypothetical protein